VSISKTLLRDRGSLIGWLLLAAAYWGALFNQLRVEWSANDQYAYGWFVPILALGLLWLRWQDRPPSAVVAKAWSVGRGAWGILLLLLLILPVRLLEESSFGWRSAWWAHVLILAALSLWGIRVMAGAAWARHFAFPILFLLVGVPWLNKLETPIVSGLMRTVAAISVSVAHLLGIPAARHGNLIEIGSGTLSVDGACSGVRSLQTSLMIALLLGEVFRLRARWRVALVGLGFCLAFAANVARTSLLTWGAATRSVDYMEKTLHDPAGLVVVAVVLGGIYVAAFGFQKAETLKSRKAEIAARGQGSEVRDQKSEVPTSALCISPFSFSAFQLFSICIWLVFTETATAYWFHLGDQRSVTNPVWSVNWPTNAPAYVESGLTKTEQSMLRCDMAKKASWLDDAANNWSLIALRWGPENKNAFLGHLHTPDQCFTGAGWLLRGEPEPVRVQVNGLELPFRRYVFEVDGRAAYAFLGFWDERSPRGEQELPLAYGYKRRIEAAWHAKHHQGFKKLEVAIIGPASEDEAVAVLRDGLQKLIVVSGPRVVPTRSIRPDLTR
jgi:exosortase